MKLKTILATSCLLFGSLAAANAQNVFSFGPKIGAGFAYQGQDKVPQSVTITDQTKIVPSIGLFGEATLPLFPMGLNVGLSYRQKGSKRDFGDNNGSYTVDQTLHYLSADATVKLYIFKGGVLRPYVGLGARADLRISKSDKVTAANAAYAQIASSAATPDDAFKNAVISGIVVVGTTLGRVGLELEWNPNLTNAASFNYNNGSINGTVNTKNTVFGANIFFNILKL